ncbi:MAG: FAD-dependent oxidoreductase [Pseudomonadota bacterium]
MSFPTLLSPLKIGKMQLRNRVAMSPMTTNYGSDEQGITDRLLAYLEARAEGGVGLIGVEVCSVDLQHRYQPQSLSLAEDRFIDEHARLVERMHAHGAMVQPQITHPGPESLSTFYEQLAPVGPSVLMNPTHQQACRQLAARELPAIIEQYVAAAERAQRAGYDGMELHAAHAYMLLGSFLSPLRNNRDDDYGGKKLEPRARLLVETLSAVRAAVGDDFPITVSLSGYERYPAGRDLNETQQLAPMLVAAGASAFRVSGGITDKLVTSMIMSSDFSDGLNVSVAEAIRQVVDVPVMVVGRIHTPEHAERILVQGRADLIGIGRPLLADPDWVNKARLAKSSRIRRCISCETCIDSMQRSLQTACAINAASGREREFPLTVSPAPKRVVVVGAGAAGMEAARVAALRGHRVTLLDRQRRLGGSLLMAATVHADNQHFLDWLCLEIRSLGVDIRLGQEVNQQVISGLQPDAILVATGAQIQVPDIAGAGHRHVYSGAQLRRLLEGTATREDMRSLPLALRGMGRWTLQRVAPYLTPARLRRASRIWLPLGHRVAIVGADLAAIELAEFLAHRGRRVHVLDASKRLAMEVGPKRRAEHMDRLERLGVTVNTQVHCTSIDRQALYYRTAQGVRRQLPVDSVILAGEPQAAKATLESMQSLAPEVHAIGDCNGLGLIAQATAQAMAVAHRL